LNYIIKNVHFKSWYVHSSLSNLPVQVTGDQFQVIFQALYYPILSYAFNKGFIRTIKRNFTMVHVMFAQNNEIEQTAKNI